MRRMDIAQMVSTLLLIIIAGLHPEISLLHITLAVVCSITYYSRTIGRGRQHKEDTARGRLL